MNNLTVIGYAAEQSSTLDSLWAQAEFLGKLEIDRPVGNVGYRASIRLPDWSSVNGKVDHDVKVSIADAIRKARLIC
tara:strand:+ start:726 stop:956 length:231 start_codon:yes stop_codon:yes gene_type:complete